MSGGSDGDSGGGSEGGGGGRMQRPWAVAGSPSARPVRESWQIDPSELQWGRRLGRGTVGDVYRGVYRGRAVAIKRLRSEWLGDADTVARFRDEILLLSTMNHANVLMFVGAVMDVPGADEGGSGRDGSGSGGGGRDDGQHYPGPRRSERSLRLRRGRSGAQSDAAASALRATRSGDICLVTELCERGTLQQVLASLRQTGAAVGGGAALPWPLRVKIARDIARGMDYLHSKAGVIQRDLKSANLLVTRGFDIKVADFGLSRQLAEPGRMRTCCGTPATMAPEVVRQEPYTEKADVFSFAVILWELLTREEPYPGWEGLPLAYAVANEGLRPLIPAYCPAEWAALMTQCWSDDPRARPSFDEVQRTLFRLQRMFDAPRPKHALPAAAEGTGPASRSAGPPSLKTAGRGQPDNEASSVLLSPIPE
jgi:serine/threonine protein kinase